MRFSPFLLCVLVFVGCQNEQSEQSVVDLPPNQLAIVQPDNLQGFRWMNEPDSFFVHNEELTILAVKGTDFFNNPENNELTSSAPYLFQHVSGDFVATLRTQPDLIAQWNAGALLMHMNSLNWIKLAYENSDATGPSIVSVVTRGVSDDANGAILNDQQSVWLRLIRKGSLFAMHWSSDGKHFKMARLSAMPKIQGVKIGIEAQCPVGELARHRFSHFSLERRTVSDLRKGE